MDSMVSLANLPVFLDGLMIEILSLSCIVLPTSDSVLLRFLSIDARL